MSTSLLRRGLELFGPDVTEVGKHKQQQRRKSPSSASAMELVSSSRQGVTKQLRRLRGQKGPGRSRATVKDKRVKCAVEEFRKKQGKSHLQQNLRYLLGSACATADSDTMKIVNHSSGRQSRNRPDQPPAKKQNEQESVFTEEEFQKFQREYFGRTVEEKK